MKKVIAVLAATVILCAALSVSASAFAPHVVYGGQAGCRLLSWSFTQQKNMWLLWDVTFKKVSGDRVWETEKEHPNLIGRQVIPTFSFEGESVSFNGITITSGVTSIVLKEQNDVVITAGRVRAEYQIAITEKTNGLPVVLIDTANAAISNKTDYVNASVSVLGGSGRDIYAATAGVRLRGNSTLGFPKKAYRIKFGKTQNPFDLGQAKNWTLIANYIDPAFIRNEIAYSFASRLNQMTAATREDGFLMFTPRMVAVEVYLNGHYLGLYDFSDHMQVNEIRVDIDEGKGGGEDVGYFIEAEAEGRVLEEYENEGTPYFTVKAGGWKQEEIYFQFKSPEEPTAAQIAYIQNYMQTVSDLAMAKDPAVWDYVDRDSFIDWYLANELFKNPDSPFQSSCFLYKDKGGLLRMGPVWDFDRCAGAVAYIGLADPEGWRTKDSRFSTWYKNFFEMSEFADAVHARWAKRHEEGLLDQIFTDIDEREPYLLAAATEDYAKWHERYANTARKTMEDFAKPDCLDPTRWEEQLQYVRSFMRARIQWIDKEYGYAPKTSDLGGTLAIRGIPECDVTVKADMLAVMNAGTDVTYQWYRNGMAIDGTAAETYTLTAEDVGKQITLQITTSKGSLTSDPVTVQKAKSTEQTTYSTPLIFKSSNQIVVDAIAGSEYHIDGGDWQTSGVFDGLAPNTFYRVYRRRAETDTGQGSLPGGKPLYVITDPAEVGDLDAGGVRNMADAFTLYRAASGQIALTDWQQVLADVEENGIINMADAFALYRQVSGG
ncbi:MAG: CotH kinase family protein [Clostridia bacterium]|nr:CotH kinase family protein [Clostridia bacterium]